MLEAVAYQVLTYKDAYMDTYKDTHMDTSAVHARSCRVSGFSISFFLLGFYFLLASCVLFPSCVPGLGDVFFYFVFLFDVFV